MSSDSTKADVYLSQQITSDLMPAFIQIAQSAFGVLLDEETLLKKFNTSFSGASYIGSIAFNNGEPSAYYGVFPVLVTINQEHYLVAQSGDTMTHKTHQGKGLFVRLAKETYEIAQANKIQLVFGFPNENSYPGFVKKLDWKHENDLLRFTKKITTVPFSALAAKYNWFSSIYKSVLKNRLKKRVFFESSINATGQNGVFRNQDYWNYKGYASNFTFQVAGIQVWAKIDGVLHIGDIEYKESVNYNDVLSGIERRARLWGCHKIVFQCSQDTWLASILSGSYNQSKGLPVGYLSFNTEIPFHTLKFTQADFDTF